MKRSGLGKGLGALIPSDSHSQEGSVFQEIPISDIEPNPRQPRAHFDEEALSGLAASIRELGVLQPVLVRPTEGGRYSLVAGERRWRAARRVGLQNIPALVQMSTDTESLEKALVENLHRTDLNPLEEAAAFVQLVEEFGHTHEQVAQRVGKSRSAVTNSLRLLQLPPGAQRAVRDGQLSAGHARALLGTPDRAFQEELARRAVNQGLSVRAVEDLVRQHDGRVGVPGEEDAEKAAEGAISEGDAPTPARHALREPGLLELEQLLESRLNTSVKVELGAKRGRVVIEFSGLEDLERIYMAMFSREG